MAGLTTMHLLPAFDIASVDEDKSTWSDGGRKTARQLRPGFGPTSAGGFAGQGDGRLQLGL